MSALMLPLPTEETTAEEKTTKQHLHGPTQSHVPLNAAIYSRKFGSSHASGHITIKKTAKRRRENLEWKGVVGSLTATTIAETFDSTLNLKRTRLLRFFFLQSSLFFFLKLSVCVARPFHESPRYNRNGP